MESTSKNVGVVRGWTTHFGQPTPVPVKLFVCLDCVRPVDECNCGRPEGPRKVFPRR